MYSIKASNQHLDLRGSKRIWSFLLVSLAISLIIAFLSQTYWIPIGLFALALSTTVLLMQPIKEILVEFGEKQLLFNEHELNWSDCNSWAAVTLNDSLEIVIQTNRLPHAFYYFYLNPEQVDIKEFFKELNKYIPYNQRMPYSNFFHITLRFFGLK